MTDQKIHLGEGILKPGTRPIKVVVKDGEYYLCDAEVEPEKVKEECTAHGEIHMSEGG